jgi:hypothetical protein
MSVFWDIIFPQIIANAYVLYLTKKWHKEDEKDQDFEVREYKYKKSYIRKMVIYHFLFALAFLFVMSLLDSIGSIGTWLAILPVFLPFYPCKISHSYINVRFSWGNLFYYKEEITKIEILEKDIRIWRGKSRIATLNSNLERYDEIKDIMIAWKEELGV